MQYTESHARFSLSSARPAKKYDCPYCGGRKCFTRYVDHDPNNTTDKIKLNLQCVDGEYILGPQYGYCDHRNACGANHGPSEFFQDMKLNGENFTQTYTPKEEPPREIIPIPSDIVIKTMFNRPRPINIFDRSQWRVDSGLHKYIMSLPLSDEEMQRFYNSLAEYRIGVCQRKKVWNRDTRQWEYISSDLGTVFWLTDEQNRIRTGKMMWYMPDGHRDKQTSPSNCNYDLIRSKVLPEGYRVAYCLFGEHLLNNTAFDGKTVMVVESEKTALLCSIFQPQYLWMACQSKTNLNERFLAPLKQHHRKVTVIPDLDGYYEHQTDPKKDTERRKNSWDLKTKDLKAQGFDITCSLYVKRNATKADGDTADMADILIRKMLEKRQPTVDYGIPMTEPLKLLIERFDLVPV